MYMLNFYPYSTYNKAFPNMTSCCVKWNNMSGNGRKCKLMGIDSRQRETRRSRNHFVFCWSIIRITSRRWCLIWELPAEKTTERGSLDTVLQNFIISFCGNLEREIKGGEGEPGTTEMYVHIPRRDPMIRMRPNHRENQKRRGDLHTCIRRKR